MNKIKKIRYHLLHIEVDTHLNFCNKLVTYHHFERLSDYPSLSSAVTDLNTGDYPDGFYRLQKRVNGKLMFTFNILRCNGCVYF